MTELHPRLSLTASNIIVYAAAPVRTASEKRSFHASRDHCVGLDGLTNHPPGAPQQSHMLVSQFFFAAVV